MMTVWDNVRVVLLLLFLIFIIIGVVLEETRTRNSANVQAQVLAGSIRPSKMYQVRVLIERTNEPGGSLV